MLVANRYQLRERLAAGGIAEAWRASDLLLGHLVAVRLLRPGHTTRVKRFPAAAPQYRTGIPSRDCTGPRLPVPTDLLKARHIRT